MRRNCYSSDFETCPTKPLIKDKEGKVITKDVKARVWASCSVNIDNYKMEHLGHDIEDFYDFIKNKNQTHYFHNLKFDGKYIVPYLLKNGFTWLSQDEFSIGKFKQKTFYPVIDESGNYFSIFIYWKKYQKDRRKGRKPTWITTQIFDSLKLLPMSVKDMAKNFLGLNEDEQKGSIDYELVRPKGYILTDEEEEYIFKDCIIVAKGVKKMHELELTKSTISSNAFEQFKNIQFGGDKEALKIILPELSLQIDEYIRKAYKGGWTYCNKKYVGMYDKKISGAVFDVNSLYPYCMKTYPMPYGDPVFFNGEYKKDENYPLYVQRLILYKAKLKNGKFPMIQIKGSSRFFDETEYLERIEQPVEITVTNIDLDLIKECYHLGDIEFIDGYKFKKINGLFTAYVNYYGDMKKYAKNPTEKSQAKLMLNSLYGKFASKLKRYPIEPYLNENNILRNKEHTELEYIGTKYYCPLGCFITAYARRETITTAILFYDNFMYADTDSVHLKKCNYNKKGFNIDHDNTGEFGLWKCEGNFKDSLYLGAKKYMELMEVVDKQTKKIKGYKWDVKCAGLPQEVKDNIKDKSEFYVGKTFSGKKSQRIVEDGVLIIEGTFKIKKGA